MSDDIKNPDIYIRGSAKKHDGFTPKTADNINKHQAHKVQQKYKIQTIKPGDVPKPRDRIVNLA